MATVVPPPSKRQKREQLERTTTQQDVAENLGPHGSFRLSFRDEDGEEVAHVVEVPVADASEKNVSMLLNTLRGHDREGFIPYRFQIRIPDSDLAVDYPAHAADLPALFQKYIGDKPSEIPLSLVAKPQAVFRVQSVTRLAHRIPGHGEAVLCASFSPESSRWLATGSGDSTARIWDADTGTPKHTLSGHTGWVLDVRWSPDGKLLATGSKDKTVRVFDPATGKPVGQAFGGHSNVVTALAWEPYHRWQDGTRRLASASKDGTCRVWIANTGRTEHVLSGHKGSVTCVKWGGTGLIYTGSHDRTIRVWNAEDGRLAHELKDHAHWVNHLALSSDFALRTGYFDHTKEVPATEEERRAKAKERFEKAVTVRGRVAERFASASDDLTVYLWDLGEGKKPIAKMVGHAKQVNHVTFSPDGALLASASWDNSTKIWDARDGKFLATLRGHVAPVYQCAFSADSRLLVTSSKDSTLKVWNMRTHKEGANLPGHNGEVYAVDWSPDGQMVGSGGQDKAVRLWRN